MTIHYRYVSCYTPESILGTDSLSTPDMRERIKRYVRPYARFVIAYTEPSDLGYVRYAVSFCNPIDQFVRRDGRELATMRLNSSPSTCEIPSQVTRYRDIANFVLDSLRNQPPENIPLRLKRKINTLAFV